MDESQRPHAETSRPREVTSTTPRVPYRHRLFRPRTLEPELIDRKPAWPGNEEKYTGDKQHSVQLACVPPAHREHNQQCRHEHLAAEQQAEQARQQANDEANASDELEAGDERASD